MTASPLARRDADGALEMALAGETLLALPCGGLWWEAERVLVVSDLHLEKGSAFAARGQFLPPYDTRATLARVAAAMRVRTPRIVVSLGDSFHDRRARHRMEASDVASVRQMASSVDWIWIAGNHDPAPPDDLGGRRLEAWRQGPLIFRHEACDAAPAASDAEISGHFHPVARVVGRGASFRARCFVSDGRRLVMPAYGTLTGGLNVLDPAIRALFPRGFETSVIGPDGVYRAPMHRLRAAG